MTSLRTACFLAMLPCVLMALDVPVFHVTDLGTLGGTNSQAYAVNDANVVVGWAENSNGVRHAFLWTNGVMADLGTLGGLTSEARDISETGYVAGLSRDTHGQTRAFLLVDGVMSNLGTLGGSFSQAAGVNDRGDVVGDSLTSAGELRPVVWRDGAIIDLAGAGSPPRIGNGLGINSRGVAVGLARVYVPQERWRPFTWEDLNGDGTNDPGEMVSHNPFGGKNGTANAINDLDQFAGSSDIRPFADGPDRAFLVVDGQTRDLGSLDGKVFAEVLDVNDGGVSVGYVASAAGAGDAEPFLQFYGVMTNLNDLIPGSPEWSLQYASGINRRGYIAGWGTVSGATHAFLLSPATSLVAFTYAKNLAGGATTFAWAGFGSNVLYTLERRDSVTSGPWNAVATTGSWPTLSMFLELMPDSTLTNPLFRVTAGE